MSFGRDAAGRQRITEGRTERDGRAVLRHQLQPQARPHRELARAQEIHRALRGHAPQHDAYQTHVVVVRQPREEAVFLRQPEAVVEDGLEVMHDRGLRDHRAARETRAARGVLQVRQLVWLGRGGTSVAQVGHGVEIRQRAGDRDVESVHGLAQQRNEIIGSESSGRLAVGDHLLAGGATIGSRGRPGGWPPAAARAPGPRTGRRRTPP